MPLIIRSRTLSITEIFRRPRVRRGLTRPTTSATPSAVRALHVRNESKPAPGNGVNLTFESARLENQCPRPASQVGRGFFLNRDSYGASWSGLVRRRRSPTISNYVARDVADFAFGAPFY